VLDEAWASAWQQSFPPLAVGERLLVAPPWEPDGDRGGERLRLVIEPGRAFGTGHHGSTEGCLVLLERALGRGPGQVLDIGTGSGILAVAAVKLGAPEVVAIDIDPDAVAAARSNAERNDCRERVTLMLAGPEEIAGAFPVVVANLLSHTHLALVPLYTRLVAPGGDLILGGILADEDPPLIAAVNASDFTLRERLVRDGWSSLGLQRTPRPPSPA
jgi:ribosomal protein L11 methyltransferase